MKDSIERQEVIDHLKDRLIETALYNIGHYEYIYLDIAQNRVETWINEIKPAQAEIIKCKDCVYKHGTECVRFSDVRISPEDFCSRAEKAPDPVRNHKVQLLETED